MPDLNQYVEQLIKALKKVNCRVKKLQDAKKEAEEAYENSKET
jgi:hypothetical protein